MCDPITITAVAVAVSAGAGAAGASAGAALALGAGIAITGAAGLSTKGVYEGAKAEKEAAKYSAAVSRNNAIIAEGQASDRLEQGKQEESNFRKQLSQLKGTQRSIYAGSGIIVDEGSALDTVVETAELGEIDAFAIRRNAEIDAYGYNNQANNFSSQATLQTAKASAIDPTMVAGTTALTQGSKLFTTFGGVA